MRLFTKVKNTTLAFKSVQDLLAFKKHITIANVVVNVVAKTLSAEFSDADIARAKTGFNAMLVETTFVPLKAPKNDNNKN